MEKDKFVKDKIMEHSTLLKLAALLYLIVMKAYQRRNLQSTVIKISKRSWARLNLGHRNTRPPMQSPMINFLRVMISET